MGQGATHVDREAVTGRRSTLVVDDHDLLRLGLKTEGTIKNHASSLLLLFGARSRAELISQLRGREPS
jgi:hypothetical protein